MGSERLLDVSMISFHIGIDKYRHGLLLYRYIYVKMLGWQLASVDVMLRPRRRLRDQAYSRVTYRLMICLAL